MKMVRKVVSTFAFGALGLAVGVGACSSSSNGAASSSDDGGASSGANSCYTPPCGTTSGGSGGSSSGFNLDGTTGNNIIYVHGMCPNGGHTSISGKVYDPASANPLYNVTVYVPGTGTVADLPSGVSCSSCSNLYSSPFASAVTDASGHFQILDVPDGSNIPLVVQVGKWRKQYKIATVNKCADNPQPDKSLRLPKNHTEGDLPQIAISTGAADSLECLLMRMGVDKSEYVAGPGTPTGGHIHIFTGQGGVGGAAVSGGTAYDPVATLWDKASDIKPYDLVLLSCEGGETANLSDAGRKVVFDYATIGGRVFASHFHYSFFTPSGAFSTITPPIASWTTGSQIDNDPISGKVVQTLGNGMAFPEGVALQSWLGNVGALTNGELPIHNARDNAQVAATNKAQMWISANQGSNFPGYAQYLSFDTMGADSVCGRVVYSDLHVSGGPMNLSDPNTDYMSFNPGIVPDQCTPHALTPQEKALEFMIFDLSSCLIPIGGNPIPPPPVQ